MENTAKKARGTRRVSSSIPQEAQPEKEIALLKLDLTSGIDCLSRNSSARGFAYHI